MNLPRILAAIALFTLSSASLAQTVNLGKLSANPYTPESTSNPYGAGSKYNANSVNNPYGAFGSRYSNKSATNPYATNAPKLYDSNGNYRGKLSSNRYDPDSISNPYGRFGSQYSSDSINNPYGAGNPYKADSPTNPYGTGWKIQGDSSATYSMPKNTGYGIGSSRQRPTYESRSKPVNPYRPGNR